MLTRIYLIIGIAIIALYGLVALTGREIGDPSREQVPASVRNSPGGYRSFHFWHVGYRGGK
ncbi:MAG TPA: hypothetical protein VJH03_12800 [Blastocatellia bacterium]|nr:hypothetical protein [Blastocatellia bacterium]